MVERIFTRLLIINNSWEPINWALFWKAKPLCCSRLCNSSPSTFTLTKGFRALFMHCIWSTKDSFFPVFSMAAFLSFSFLSRFSIMCRRGFNETIILLVLDMNDPCYAPRWLSFHIQSTLVGYLLDIILILIFAWWWPRHGRNVIYC